MVIKPDAMLVKWYANWLTNNKKEQKLLQLVKETPKDAVKLIQDNLHNIYQLASLQLKKAVLVLYTLAFAESMAMELNLYFSEQKAA